MPFLSGISSQSLLTSAATRGWLRWRAFRKVPRHRERAELQPILLSASAAARVLSSGRGGSLDAFRRASQPGMVGRPVSCRVPRVDASCRRPGTPILSDVLSDARSSSFGLDGAAAGFRSSQLNGVSKNAPQTTARAAEISTSTARSCAEGGGTPTERICAGLPLSP